MFDINCTVNDDHSQIDVEMQASAMEGDNNTNKHLGIRNRAEHCLCALHSSQEARGTRYYDLVRSYQIMICDYKVFSWENDIVEKFTFQNETGKQFDGLTAILFLDLTKANKILKTTTVDKMTPIEKWVVFLSKGNDPKHKEIIDKIIARKEGIQMTYETLTTISRNKDERARYLSRLKLRMDIAHDNTVIFQQGQEAERAISQIVIAEKNAVIADKDAVIADKDAMITRLLAQISNRDIPQ
jgi:predicted transposase/invertase (TIGR01784 family)